jgi:hypothetical protein
MSRGDRIGIAGLILACIGIGITILWPTARLIGWLAIIAAIGSGIWWAVLEFKRSKESPSWVENFRQERLGDRFVRAGTVYDACVRHSKNLLRLPLQVIEYSQPARARIAVGKTDDSQWHICWHSNEET